MHRSGQPENISAQSAPHNDFAYTVHRAVHRMMEENQDRAEYLDRLLILPMELLLYIVSFLDSVRDKAKLRYVSRTFRNVIETPSLWREFQWSYYDYREEYCVKNLMKMCGKYVRVVSFPDHVTPSKLVEMLQYCCGVTHLSLPVRTKLTSEQLREIVECMTQLQSINLLWENASIKPLLTGVHLKELTIYTSKEPRIFQWLQDWAVEGFVPQNLSIVANVTSRFVLGLLVDWQNWSSKVPADHRGTALLNFYVSLKVPLNLAPPLPVFQLHYGPSATLPFISASQFGILSGLKKDMLLLTESNFNGKVVHKAVAVSSKMFQNSFDAKVCCKVTDLRLVTHFDVAFCDKFNSNHLEQLSVTCPNLQQLNLRNNTVCLKNLQGLQSIAQNCEKLQGINLLGVPVINIESHLLLWETICHMKLTHLAVELCVVRTAVNNYAYKQTLSGLFKKCLSLKVLTIHARVCKECGKSDSSIFSLFPHFPALASCTLVNMIYHESVVQNLTRCKNLQYLHLSSYDCYPGSKPLSSASICSLQQVCLESHCTDITSTFMETVSARGGLQHVILLVNSMTIDGIATLVKNSPMLITCRVVTIKTIDDEQYEIPTVKLLKMTLMERFSHRKLFTMGSYQVEQRHHGPFNDSLLEGTDFNNPLWTKPLYYLL